MNRSPLLPAFRARLARRLRSLATAAGLVVVLTVSCSSGEGEFTVRDAWVRLPPPGSNAAAYFVLENDTADRRELVAARADAARRVEVHRSILSEGVARMERVDSIVLPPGGTMAFEPGGYHLMLIEPSGLEEGGAVQLELELSGERVLTVEAEVRRHGTQPTGGMDHSGH